MTNTRNIRQWEPCFAWLPTTLMDGDTAWLVRIERYMLDTGAFIYRRPETEL